MIWGCISARDVGRLYHCTGTVNKAEYCKILETTMLLSIQELYDGDDFVFMQNGASSHTVKYIKTWLRNHQVHILEWPPLSPDFNPIKNLWCILKQNVRKNNLQSLNRLCQIIDEK